MKRFVLIRDDDINYFSDTALLDRIYEPLFEHGLPVNFSVIPEVASDTEIGRREESVFARTFGLRHEPFIPPSHRGRKERHSICENRDLVSFIRARPVEVLQHGFRHTWHNGPEFASENGVVLKARITQGQEILENAFGKAPRFFCAPWDRISREGLRALKQMGFLGVSGWHFGRNLPLGSWPSYLKKRYMTHRQWLRWGDFLLVEHPGYFVSLLRSPAESMEMFRRAYEMCSVLVVVTHHWEFNFDGRPEPSPEWLSVWHEMMDFILRSPDAQVVTFRELYDRLRAT